MKTYFIFGEKRNGEKMYKEGDKVKYKTSYIKAQNEEIIPQEKIGVIEEACTTLNNYPCYWIEGEKELILKNQIICKV